MVFECFTPFSLAYSSLLLFGSQRAKTLANIFIAADLYESENVRAKREGINDLTLHPLNSYTLLSTRVVKTVFPSFMHVLCE